MMEYLKKISLKTEEKDWKFLWISMCKFCFSNLPYLNELLLCVWTIIIIIIIIIISIVGYNIIVIKGTGHQLVAHQPPV